MQNIFIVHRKTTSDLFSPMQLVGVYSSKEKADAAGAAACELMDKPRYIVTILPLDGIID